MGQLNPTFLVGHLYFRGQPAQMQPLTGNGRKETLNRKETSLNRISSVDSQAGILGKPCQIKLASDPIHKKIKRGT
jgi:hypothetical protein